METAVRPVRNFAPSLRSVQASDAKARFAELLTDVERGETVIITRHGKAIATLQPRAEEAFSQVDLLDIPIEPRQLTPANMPSISRRLSASSLRLARKHSLTFYDAAYLELAVRRNAPLATLDTRLATAARSESVSVIA
jgi:prevent-host-death family protein